MLYATKILIIAFSIFLTLNSCNKLVDIAPPVSKITTPQVFATDDNATAAMNNVYYNMVNGNNATLLTSGGMTILSGLSADELLLFDPALGPVYNEFYRNQITVTNSDLYNDMWTSPFSILYGCNAVISNCTASTTLHDSVRNELIGEAKFVRAFINFYLVNLYGPIPQVTTPNWQKTNLLGRASTADIYSSMVADLQDAQKALPDNYSVGNGQKIIPNKWAATALLARVYLYLKDWKNAELQSSAIINSGNFSLVTDLTAVFAANSDEAIWQLQQDNNSFNANATNEGILIIPDTINYSSPFIYVSPTLYNSFETNDNRKTNWLRAIVYGGITYYYPYKYRVGPDEAVTGGPYLEYYMGLRYGEQLLIRAEAKAEQGTDLPGAAADLDQIRNRAGLPGTGANTQADLLNAIAHERQVELFAEWGHRWLDLKRGGQAGAILTANKGFSVTDNALLYPIPSSELIRDPNLTQNNGY